MDIESCYRVAQHVRWDIHRVDQEDFVHDALLEMIEEARRNGGGLSPEETWRVARRVRNKYRHAYARQKPLSLNRAIQGTEGIELQETLAAPEIDLDAWLDAKIRLEGCPPGVKKIARKLEKGDPLTSGEKAYLRRFREDGRTKAQQVWEMKRYHQRRALGLCVRCGEKVEDGFARCARCRERCRACQALYKRRKGLAWQAKLRKHWRKEGRCTRCGRLPEPGRKKCSRCLARDRENLRRWKERQKKPPRLGQPGRVILPGESCGEMSRGWGRILTRELDRLLGMAFLSHADKARVGKSLRWKLVGAQRQSTGSWAASCR